ncbi:MAG: Multidrug resistance protein MdtE precursor [Pelotomaculum sp. PtaB.Bin104]|nr:MAG: Multidrug resistance protein MdtE precursor [Pelotomaculum sp. PtaB.Bin104]
MKKQKKLNIQVLRFLLIPFLLLFLSFWLGGCSTEQQAKEDVPLVRILTIKSDEGNQKSVYPGEVCGRNETKLAFQVNGKIIKRNVDLGSVVKQGDLLMQLDSRDFQQNIDAIGAQLSSAQSQLNLATDNLKRYRQLYEQKAISKAEYDSFQNTYNSAEALVRQITAQYEQAVNQLNYTNLYSDCNGVVKSIDGEVGQMVGPGVVTSRPQVVTIVRDGEREVEINVPENRLDELRKAEKIQVKFWALPDVVIDGRVREISPVADQVSRTYKVRVSLVNPPEGIELGMTSSVIISGAARQQATAYIPLPAIYQTGDTPAVWVVNDGVVHLRSIKVGAFGDNQVQILEGLKDGEIIVTAGVQKLREGQRVRTSAGEAR